MNEIAGDVKESWIEQQKVNYLDGHVLVAVLTGGFIVLLFGWIEYDFITLNRFARIWFYCGIALSLFGILHVAEHRLKKPLLTNRQWLIFLRFHVIGFGIIFGSMVYIFFDQVDSSLQTVILFLTIAIPAIALPLVGPDRPTFIGLIVTCIFPTAFFLIQMDDSELIIVAFLLLLFALASERISVTIGKFFTSNIEMSYAMKYRATHDQLVGLFNREELEHQFELHAPQSKRAVAMMFVDLDNFKPLNDTLGHQAGDQALIDVANIIKQNIRSDDIASRLGGDEFVVVLFVHNEEEVLDIAKTISAKVCQIPFDSSYAGLSTSIGIGFHQHTKVSFSRLMRVADMAMYESKEAGKNMVTILQYES